MSEYIFQAQQTGAFVNMIFIEPRSLFLDPSPSLMSAIGKVRDITNHMCPEYHNRLRTDDSFINDELFPMNYSAFIVDSITPES